MTSYLRPLSVLGEVKIHTSNQPPSFTEIKARRTKTSLLKTLDSPTYTERRTLDIPNIDGGNCDFSVSNDPLRNATLSPRNYRSDPDAVGISDDSPAFITYKFVDFERQKSSSTK